METLKAKISVNFSNSVLCVNSKNDIPVDHIHNNNKPTVYFESIIFDCDCNTKNKDFPTCKHYYKKNEIKYCTLFVPIQFFYGKKEGDIVQFRHKDIDMIVTCSQRKFMPEYDMDFQDALYKTINVDRIDISGFNNKITEFQMIYEQHVKYALGIGFKIKKYFEFSNKKAIYETILFKKGFLMLMFNKLVNKYQYINKFSADEFLEDLYNCEKQVLDSKYYNITSSYEYFIWLQFI